MSSLIIDIPNWLEKVVKDGRKYKDEVEKMNLAIEMSRKNIEVGGGPFGAAIFDIESGELVSLGVNLVVSSLFSISHAEIISIMCAQNRIKNFDLGESMSLELYSSSEPCIQCFGAIHWSGLKRVVYGATKIDVEKIGFDEGPKPSDWEEIYKKNGIKVNKNVLRSEAVKVLDDYKKSGMKIYNAS